MPHVKHTTLALRSCEPRNPPHTPRGPTTQPTPPPPPPYDGCALFSEIGDDHTICYKLGVTHEQAEACVIWLCLHHHEHISWWQVTHYDLAKDQFSDANTSWPDCVPIFWWFYDNPPPGACEDIEARFEECLCPFPP